VALCSYANNLVGEDTNGTYDIFLHDPSEAPPGYEVFLPLVLEDR
jgi:hypothetical protein